MNTADVPPNAKLHEGVWLPATEQHFVDMMSPGAKRFTRDPYGRATYQKHKLDAAVGFLSAGRRRVAVDVGAHVGLWAMHLVEVFDHVHSFEPVPAFADIYPHNMRKPNWALHRCALGDQPGHVRLTIRATDTGCTHISGAGDIELRTLDSMDLSIVDFLKIDVEGFEGPVVHGARETLLRCRPIIVVEQKLNDHKNFGRPAGEAVAFLRDLGMVDLREAMAGDHIMGWTA